MRSSENLIEIAINSDRPNEPGAIRRMRLEQRGSGPARFIATDFTGTEDEGACGLMQDSWDAIAHDFINVPLDAASLFPPDPDVRLTAIAISFSAVPRQVPIQQGAVRFRVDLLGIHGEGEWRGIGFTVVSTEPSVFEFEVAPFIVGGARWFTRSAAGRIRHIDVLTSFASKTTFPPSLSAELTPRRFKPVRKGVHGEQG